jgi:hypothetical protein
MKRLMLLVPSVALLFACSDSAVSLQPGQWETSIRFTSIEVPGAPEAQVAPMRAMLSQPQTSSNCVTPEQAANPGGNLLSPRGDANNCTYTENTFSGGTIRVRGSCSQSGGAQAQMSMEGTYTATTMEAQISSEIQAPPGTQGPQTVRMSGALTGRRTGDCPAS